MLHPRRKRQSTSPETMQSRAFWGNIWQHKCVGYVLAWWGRRSGICADDIGCLFSVHPFTSPICPNGMFCQWQNSQNLPSGWVRIKLHVLSEPLVPLLPLGSGNKLARREGECIFLHATPPKNPCPQTRRVLRVQTPAKRSCPTLPGRVQIFLGM